MLRALKKFLFCKSDLTFFYNFRFLIQAAAQNHGVIVSNDKFRDILSKLSSSNDFLQHQTITERLLQFGYHEGDFMFPDDPYGRNGPSLNQLLSFPFKKKRRRRRSVKKTVANGQADDSTL